MDGDTTYAPFYLDQSWRFDIVSSLQSIISSCEQIYNQLDYMQLILNNKPSHATSGAVDFNSSLTADSRNDGGTVVSTICNYFMEELYLIHQTATVGEFHQQFEALQTRVLFEEPGLPEEFFTSLFINGLRKDVQNHVLSFHPLTVIDAFHLACIYEYPLRSSVKTTQDSQEQLQQNTVDNVVLAGYSEIDVVADSSSSCTDEGVASSSIVVPSVGNRTLPVDNEFVVKVISSVFNVPVIGECLHFSADVFPSSSKVFLAGKLDVIQLEVCNNIEDKGGTTLPSLGSITADSPTCYVVLEKGWDLKLALEAKELQR